MRDLLISLRSVEKRYEGKLFGVGELHISGMVKDCADAIEKLLAENAQLRKELEQQRIDKNHLHEIIAEQGKKIGEYELNPAYKQAKAERDAAIKDLQIIADAGSCDVCAYDGQSCKDAVHKADVNGGSCFKWRGLDCRKLVRKGYVKEG